MGIPRGIRLRIMRRRGQSSRHKVWRDQGKFWSGARESAELETTHPRKIINSSSGGR